MITRHGGGSHYVRPDRVYRTGVISSTMGYDPGADVQDVAASFTQYPMDLGLSGFGAIPGIFTRMKLRFQAWRASMKAKSMMAGLRGLGDFTPDAYNGGMAYPQVGAAISPPQFAKEAMVAQLTAGGLSPAQARGQVGFSMDRWNNMRWNG